MAASNIFLSIFSSYFSLTHLLFGQKSPKPKMTFPTVLFCPQLRKIFSLLSERSGWNFELEFIPQENDSTQINQLSTFKLNSITNDQLSIAALNFPK